MLLGVILIIFADFFQIEILSNYEIKTIMFSKLTIILQLVSFLVVNKYERD